MTSTDWKASTGIDWEALRNRPLSVAEKRAVRAFYATRYHDGCDYTANAPFHELVHRRRAQLLLAVFPQPGKVLDAGCSAGGTVKALRALGVDAWGFDICPDLHDIVYPEARSYVRIGDFEHVPFSAADGFSTLVSYDVFEHAAVDVVEQFPARIRELGVRDVCCVISNDTHSIEHITIQSTDWYVERFEAAGYRLMDEITEDLRGLLWPLPGATAGDTFMHCPFDWSGDPTNHWNGVPGFVFFTSAR